MPPKSASRLSAVGRGAEVVVTSGEAKAEGMRALGAKVTAYGEGLEDRVRELAPGGVDRVVDLGPGGLLGTLVSIAGGDPAHVVTVTDFVDAEKFGVRASGRAGTVFRLDAIQTVADAVAAGTLTVPVWRVEPWENVAQVQEDVSPVRPRARRSCA